MSDEINPAETADTTEQVAPAEKKTRVQIIDERIEALKKQKRAALRAEKRIEARNTRKTETHLKILIGGYIIAEKDTATLKHVLSSELRDTDREAMEALIERVKASK
jgi:lipopolysaccharide biosynthesis regulator YciM